MIGGDPPSGTAGKAESRMTTIRYLTAVCLLPLAILWRQDNILFTGYGTLDPWFYFGYFRDLLEFKKLMPGFSIGEHLSWILPGAALHRVLDPVAAGCILHFGVYLIAAISLFLILNWMVGGRRAFATSIVFALNPWVWFSMSWDNSDGASIALFLITIALFTWSALAPPRRWALLAAGIALAALVYSNSDWILLAPLPPLYYLGITHAWHRAPWRRSLLLLGGWAGAGCLLLTVAFCAINRRLDGHPFFYASVVQGMLEHTRSPSPWWSGLWQRGALSYWLLIPAAATAASIEILFRQRREPGGLNAGALFAWLFLAALGCMTLRQVRGDPVLGAADHCSILMPLSFLVIGTRFWKELKSAPSQYYVLFCCLALVIFSAAWQSEGSEFASGLPYPVWIGLAVLLAGLLWRLSPENVFCSLGGFVIFAALGVGPCFGVAPHGYREQYQAICYARERIELARHGQAVRFWFDKSDPAVNDAVALSTSYLPGSVLSQSFNATPCDMSPAPETVVAIIASDRSLAAITAPSRLQACFIGKQLRAVPVEMDAVQRGPVRYFLTLLRVESGGGN